MVLFQGQKNYFQIDSSSHDGIAHNMEHKNGVEQYSSNPDLNGKIRDWLKWDKVRWLLFDQYIR